MSKAEFQQANTTQAFLQAVAAAAGVGVGEINIVSVVDSGGGGGSSGRRLLWSGDASALAGVHVQLQARNAVSLSNLDRNLQRVGLAASAAHSHFEAHSVDVRRVPSPSLQWPGVGAGP